MRKMRYIVRYKKGFRTFRHIRFNEERILVSFSELK